MATNPIGGTAAPVTFPNFFATFDRGTIASAVEVLVAVLDAMDGDTDIEQNGDELDGTAGEDDFYPHSNWRGEPGCPLSDPGGEDQDSELTPDWGIDQTESLPDALVITSDRQQMRRHRDRIRRDCCDKTARFGVTEYRLRDAW